MSQRTPSEQRQINEAVVAAHCVLDRITGLGKNRKYTAYEKRQMDVLMARIHSLKAGFSLEETMQAEVDKVADENGLERRAINPTALSDQQHKVAKSFREFVIESRDGGVTGGGDPLAAIGHYAGLGYFVPAGFLRDTTNAALKMGDEILNPKAVNLITTSTGAPLVVPTYNDTSEDAAPTPEGSLNIVDDVQYPGNVVLGAVTYRQTYIASLEALQDVEASGNLLNLWQQWTAQRIARGVGKRMIAGLNTDAQVGLVNQLENAGCIPIIATGSSANTGGLETGVNSIGSSDLANLVWNLDDMYANSDKCAFWMARKTLLKLSQIVTKQGIPLVKWEDGKATIYSYRVRICPTLPTPAASKVTVLFGDGNFINVRRVLDKLSGVRILKETFADAGQIGLQTISRWHMALGFNGQGQCPFTILQQTS